MYLWITILVAGLYGHTRTLGPNHLSNNNVTHCQSTRLGGNPISKSVTSVLSNIDCQVIRLGLTDLKNHTNLSAPKNQTQIILHEQTRSVPTQFMDRAWAISLSRRDSEAKANFRKRNSMVYQTKNLADNKLILVGNLLKPPSSFGSMDSLQEAFPRARIGVFSTIPGYSKSNRAAIIVFVFGPSSHGARAIYRMVRIGTKWKITARNIAYFA